MRYLTAEIERLLAEELKMCFVAGPRQVGKTTLAKHHLTLTKSPSTYFNWDVESDRKLILRSPEDFWLRRSTSAEPRKEAGRRKSRIRLALDEIHKFPRWKRFLKGLHDAHSIDLDILVTGSGRLDVYQRGGDSLFGRYQIYHLYPFTVGELLSADRAFLATPDTFVRQILESRNSDTAQEALRTIETFTGFPEPLFAESETRLRRWSRSHEQLIVREELRDLTRIRDLGLIESLADLLPDRIGSPLSINALREDLAVRFETVQNWLAALDRLFYLFSIRPYAGKLARTLRREEKIYLFDFSTISDAAARFENLVALHLLKLCSAWTDFGYGDFGLSYVRDREKREVDFLITERGKPFALVEAKLTAADVDPSLSYFAERLKPRYAVQIVRTPDRFNSAFVNRGVLLAPATQALAVM
ncbi:MAG: ATP-binding protein [Ignavibacteria bacterium]|nr:ATP-binding protein [Ignavibacteria bacterium]